MKAVTASVLAGALLTLSADATATLKGRDVDTMYPYKGPKVPVGDLIDQTVNGNGKGWERVVEAPAVAPSSANPTNNINVINTAYFPGGMNVHFQTPFGLGSSPAIKWGKSADTLTNTATGSSKTYGRVPSCSQVRPVTQCNEFFHDVTIDGLESSTTYYYQIQAANGTTASHVMSFKTARAAGDKTSYTFGVLNDMGYTYAGLTHGLMQEAISNDEIDFFAHGGDLSYADDWNYGLLPCKDDPSSVCYNGADSTTSGAGPIEPDFLEPLPEGEQPTRGTPRGGDAAPLYETNWDVWQQWMNNITTKVPYMVAPGNHESGCVAHDANNLTANYLNHDKLNSTEPTEPLNYYSCPPSQRNFTTYQHRYTMPGDKTGGVGNMWYSWDYGMVHFVMLNAETDYPKSPESSFATDLEGKNYTHVKPEDTGSEDSGPFGAVTGDINDPSSYEQVQWVAKDLAAVDRCVTPWVVVIGHRPFYSSSTAGWQEKIRAAFENIFLENKVDAYLAGHIHFYERMRPLGADGWIDTEAQIDNHTYIATGNSITHLTNGAAGNLGSHDTFDGPALDITQHLDQEHFGFVKAKVNETALIMNYYNAADGSIVDHVTILKPSGSGSCGSSNGTATATATATASGSGPGNGNGVTVTTEVVTAYTTWCPGATEITHGSHTYTVTEATTLTITDCPCTLTHTISHPSAAATSTMVPVGPGSESGSSPSGTAMVPPAASGQVVPVGPGSNSTVVAPPAPPAATSQVVPGSDATRPTIAGAAVIAAFAVMLL